MKKLILIAGICISSLLGVQAQKTVMNVAGPNADKQTEKTVSNMTSVCTLTADQVKNATPIVKEFFTAKIANKQQFGSDKTKLKAANQEAAKTMKDKLSKILNADQQAKWTAYVKGKQADKKNAKASKTQQ